MELTELIERFRDKYPPNTLVTIELFADGSSSIIDVNGTSLFLFYTIEELIEHLK